MGGRSVQSTIFKNTLFLYGRMMFNMGVSLYTSRLILDILGVSDFGIYNLVGGMVVLFSFFNNAMSTATQRFLNIERATEDPLKVNKVFNVSVFNHRLIALIILLLAETFGIWLMRHKLNIPMDRLVAANWVYHLSVLTILFQIIRTPFNALLLAYEHMAYYAYIGILETVLKFGSVVILFFLVHTNHLISYAVLTLATNLVVNIILYLYCRKKLPTETRLHWVYETSQALEHLRFAGWSLLGQFAVTGSTQGLNMLLNIFFGVVLNAAMGIANQVNAAIFAFVSNVQVAFNPQIVQTYAAGNRSTHIDLVFFSSRCSLYLMALLFVPFIFLIDPIMQFWLGDNLPHYAVDFTKIVLAGSLITALSGPFWMSAYAIGDIGKYQLWVSLFNILSLPIAYLLLKIGYSPIMVLVARLLIDILMFFYRLYYFTSKLQLSWPVLRAYLIRCLPILLLVAAVAFIQNRSIFPFPDTPLIALICSEMVVFAAIFFWGMKRSERTSILRFITSKYYAYTKAN